MSSEDRAPRKPSITGHKRERSPTPTMSKTPSPSRDLISPSIAIPVTVQRPRGVTAREQSLWPTSLEDRRASPLATVPAIEQRQHPVKPVAHGQWTPALPSTRSEPPLAVQTTEQRSSSKKTQEQSQRLSLNQETGAGPFGAGKPRGQRPSRTSSGAQAHSPPPPDQSKSGPSAHVPTPEQCYRSSALREQRHRPSFAATRPSRSENIMIPRQHSRSTASRERGQRNSSPQDRRPDLFADIALRRQRSPKTSSREHSQSHSREVSADAEECAQTQQMLKVTQELRKLNEMLEPCSSSSAHSSLYEPRARQTRPRVLVSRMIVNDFDREMCHVNRAVWNDPKLPSTVMDGGPYSEEINAIVREVPDVHERYNIFQRKLLSLYRPPGSAAESGDDARKEQIRQLKLVMQDLAVRLMESDCQTAREGSHVIEQEVDSSPVPSVVSRMGNGARPGRPRRLRTVHLLKPL